jgi:hypothetical protein
MFKSTVYSLIFLFIVSSAWGQSAKRKPGENWAEAARRNYFATHGPAVSRVVLGNENLFGFPFLDSDAAYTQKKTMAEISPESVPVWHQKDEDFLGSFEKLRDARVLEDESRPKFMRRLTWLYPDDGCFARAAWMDELLEEWGFQTGAKIFAFGDLVVNTGYSTTGEVNWWYHVAIAFRKDDKIFVFDPALQSQKPMTLQEWAASMSNDPKSVMFSVCNRKTIGPFSDCINPKTESKANLAKLEQFFLPLEWQRMITLRKDPEEVLGDTPPWVFRPNSDQLFSITRKP